MIEAAINPVLAHPPGAEQAIRQPVRRLITSITPDR